MLKTLADIWRDFVAALGAHRTVLRTVLFRIIAILAAAAFVEVFIFNYNFFATLGNKPQNITKQLQGQLPETMDGEGYNLTTLNHSIEFSGLNMAVDNIRIQLDDTQSAQVITATIHFTDEAHQTYFDSNEYAGGIPDVQMATNSAKSQYFNLNASGEVGSLKVDFGGDNISYPITIKKVVINAHRPFSFEWMRFGLLVAVLALLYLFRPKSAIYRLQVNRQRLQANLCIGLAVVIELVAMSSFMLYGSNLVGVATSQYNYGAWDKHSLVNTYEVGGKTGQQYAELAKSLAEGHLYLDAQPPDWLVSMDDPYDKGARDELQKQTGQSYRYDTAYYNGHYYVYFGVVPVLIYYLPFYLVTGESFPTAIGVLMSGILFVIGVTQLLLLFARNHFKRVSLGVFLLVQMPLVCCCGLLYLLKMPTFYCLPIVTGLAFSVWGLYFWMRGRSAKQKCGWFIAGSACMALVLGCRPQLVVLSLVALPLFWHRYITQRQVLTRKGAQELACLLGPYVVIFGALMMYNYARFGSLMNFGANYNLTTNDMTRRGFNLGRLAPALFSYFLQPPHVTGEFPYLQAATFQTTYLGQTIREATYGGIFCCIPLLWVLFYAVPILKMRIRARKTHTVARVCVVMVTMGFVIACLDAEMAGILQRYYTDFSFFFLSATALLVFIVNDGVDHSSERACVYLTTLIVLVAVTLLYQVMLCLVPETGWVSEIYPWAYQNLLEVFEFWT